MLRTLSINGKERHLTGWKKDLPDARDQKLATSFWGRFTLPAERTLRNEFYISRIEDQESLGSCTCNAGSSAEEMVLKRNGKNIQLSRLWLYAEVRKLERTPLTEDPGAQIRSVMKVLANKGCPLESQYPYDLRSWTQNPPPALEFESIKNQVVVYYRCPGLAQIRASIAQGSPVAGGFRCPVSLTSADTSKTGVIEYAPVKGFDGGHAVLFTGYNDKTRLLEFQNSWGDGWGDRGYGFLPYPYVENGYADDFWTIRMVRQ